LVYELAASGENLSRGMSEEWQNAHKGAVSAVDVKGPLESAVCLLVVLSVLLLQRE